MNNLKKWIFLKKKSRKEPIGDGSVEIPSNRLNHAVGAGRKVTTQKL